MMTAETQEQDSTSPQQTGSGKSLLEGKALRQRFGPSEDNLLLLQVKADEPYKARHGAIGETWDGLADRLNAHPDFHMRPIKGTTAKARFDTLVLRHRQLIELAGGVENLKDLDSPFQKLLAEVVNQMDHGATGTSKVPEADSQGKGLDDQSANKATESRNITRLGKRRASSSSDTMDAECRGRQAMSVLPHPVRTDQTQAKALCPTENTQHESEVAPDDALPSSPVTGDLVTVQQAMAELLKVQHEIAARSTESRSVLEVEKMTEARIREEEEKTKQRGLQLQIEIERTKRRQLELDFEREERKKDREEQAKLVVRLLECLVPKNK
ncbi:hypothetical protein PsorP6_011033 [Peronosclerospora sorghi]|uniref:Uncharacterized protein n=1 Tax=Peronosclerospora sorghi TaxID=230839 RepID=A0ACC0VVP8_9STRA|nr:hypothetical protein PsorP6_011033 [Peronosclerospora sorghi]